MDATGDVSVLRGMLNGKIEISGGTQVVMADKPQPTAKSQVAANEIPFDRRLLSKREMAVYLGVTERTLEAWMRRRIMRQIPRTKQLDSLKFIF